ncbi:MAG: M56 family metallopeptidase [Ruthenibacterium sp.]
MEQFLLDFLQISALTGALIVLFALCSPFLRRRFRAQMRCFVWLLLAARLLFPFSIALPQAKAPIQIDVPQHILTQTVTLQPAILPQTETSFPQSAPPDVQNAPSVRAKPSFSRAQILFAVWLTGAAALLFVRGIAYAAWKKRTFRWNKTAPITLQKYADAAFKKAQCRPLCVYENETISSPMVVGIFRPVVLIPHGLAADSGTALMLLHEAMHQKRHDVALKIVFQAALCLHWFNPAVWLLCKEAQKDIELACDEAVLHSCGNGCRVAYSNALLCAAQQKAPLFTTQFGGGKRILRQRFQNLFVKKRRRGAIVFVAMALCLALCGGLVACTLQVPAVASSLPPVSQTATNSNAKAASGMTFPMPKATEASTYFGEWQLDAFHYGMDLRGSGELEIVAADAGTVFEILPKSVTLTHENGLLSRYVELESIAVSKGQTVEKGEKIGTSTTFLHFEMQENGLSVDPLRFVSLPESCESAYTHTVLQQGMWIWPFQGGTAAEAAPDSIVQDETALTITEQSTMPVRAAMGGTLTLLQNGVVVQAPDGTEFIYENCTAQENYRAGDRVYAGQCIAQNSAATAENALSALRMTVKQGGKIIPPSDWMGRCNSGPAACRNVSDAVIPWDDGAHAVIAGDSMAQEFALYPPNALQNAMNRSYSGVGAREWLDNAAAKDGSKTQIAAIRDDLMQYRGHHWLFVLCGTNALASKSAEAAARDMDEWLAWLRENYDAEQTFLPADIAAVGILPITAEAAAKKPMLSLQNTTAYNDAVRKTAQKNGMRFVEVPAALLAEDGSLNPHYAATDGIHITAEATQIWANAILSSKNG